MNGWRRVTKQHPCPVCGSDHACTVSTDGAVALCLRVSAGCMTRRDGSKVEAKNGMGFLHAIGKSTGDKAIRVTAKDDHLTVTECRAMQRSFETAVNSAKLAKVAAELGVQEKTLRLFGIGHCEKSGAWTFPMFDGKRRICGFRTRDASGAKRSIRGSRNGLFIPADYEAFSTDFFEGGPLLLLLPEGPTDAATAAELGFRAIGRPSNMGGADQLRELLASEKDRQEVVIIADHDPVKWLPDGTPFVPGWEGALSLAGKILSLCDVLKIMRPPGNLKDIRKWMQDGGRPEVFRALLQDSETITAKVLSEKQKKLDDWKQKGQRQRAAT